MRDKIKTVGNLIDKASVAFIASIDEDGFPNMKAMLVPRIRQDIKTFYFTTNTSSMRVRQYLKNDKASIYFYDKRFFRGVMLVGNMDVFTDKDSKELIWREGDEMYYPKGVTDEDYAVLRFTAFKGRYYRNFSSEDFNIE